MTPPPSHSPSVQADPGHNQTLSPGLEPSDSAANENALEKTRSDSPATKFRIDTENYASEQSDTQHEQGDPIPEKADYAILKDLDSATLKSSRDQIHARQSHSGSRNDSSPIRTSIDSDPVQGSSGGRDMAAPSDAGERVWSDGTPKHFWILKAEQYAMYKTTDTIWKLLCSPRIHTLNTRHSIDIHEDKYYKKSVCAPIQGLIGP